MVQRYNGTLPRFKRGFDSLYPLTPVRLIPLVEWLGRVLERLPVFSEIAGSLLISGRKAAR